jgi:protein SCO1/2
MRQLILLLVVAAAACSPDTALGLRRFQLSGVVVGRETSPPRIVIAHEAVPGLMTAMSMGFEIGDLSAPALADGDRIVATLVVSDTKSWLEDVKVIGHSGAPGTRTPPTGHGIPGVLVPDLPLLDQDGRPTGLRAFAGRVLVVTFIYTRCPLPDFCPLMVKHLESVRRQLTEANLGGRVAMLGITLDPTFDTPDVLRTYGESVLKGSNRFDQWTLATGTPAQVEDVARFLGVAYRAEGGLVTHTLMTVVVSHDGRIIRMLESNSWRPEELYEVVRKAIDRAPQ